MERVQERERVEYRCFLCGAWIASAANEFEPVPVRDFCSRCHMRTHRAYCLIVRAGWPDVIRNPYAEGRVRQFIGRALYTYKALHGGSLFGEAVAPPTVEIVSDGAVRGQAVLEGVT